MLKLIATRHLPGLVNLADDNGVAHVLLTVVGHHTQRSSSRATIEVGRTVLAGILAVVHTLETIDDKKEWLVLVATLIT